MYKPYLKIPLFIILELLVGTGLAGGSIFLFKEQLDTRDILNSIILMALTFSLTGMIGVLLVGFLQYKSSSTSSNYFNGVLGAILGTILGLLFATTTKNAYVIVAVIMIMEVLCFNIGLRGWIKTHANNH
jgi:hypothetical protein